MANDGSGLSIDDLDPETLDSLMQLSGLKQKGDLLGGMMQPQHHISALGGAFGALGNLGAAYGMKQNMDQQGDLRAKFANGLFGFGGKGKGGPMSWLHANPAIGSSMVGGSGGGDPTFGLSWDFD